MKRTSLVPARRSPLRYPAWVQRCKRKDVRQAAVIVALGWALAAVFGR